MKEDIGMRFKNLMDYYNLNPNSLAMRIGKSSVAIHNVIKGKNNPSFDIIEPILELFPEINSDWLILGKGEMLKSNSENKSEEINSLVEFLKKEIEMYRKRENLFMELIPNASTHLGKLFDVLYSRFVFFVFNKDKFRYIKVM